jgi:hypothetical protein
MNCAQVHSELFYLAEDDSGARTALDAHLAQCNDCRAEWKQYRTALASYQSACNESAPELRAPAQSLLGWRAARVAAVLALITLSLWVRPRQLNKDPIISQASNNPSTKSWDPPSISQQNPMIDSRDVDFASRMEALRNSIARLQSETSINKF